MPSRQLRLTCAVLLTCLAVAAVVPATTAAPADGDGATVVQQVTVHRTPDDPGHVDVSVEYAVGADAERLHVYLPRNATVESVSGFERAGPDGLDWDRRADDPSVRLRVAVNDTAREFDGYDFVDTGPWALARVTVRSTYYSAARDEWVSSWEDDPALRVTRRTDGPGYVGTTGVFLGEVRTLSAESAGESLTVVVPEAASPRTDPETVLSDLVAAADRHEVGGTSDRVVAFVAPRPVRGGGLTFGTRHGEANVWVSARSTVAGGSVWVHEYVHTRQTYRPTNQTRWLTEAGANYYGYLYPLRDGTLDYDRFRAEIGDVESGGALVAPSTWEGRDTPYDRGALVIAALDARIRNASDGAATYEDVVRRLNADTGNLTYAEFEDAVEAAAGRPLDDWLAAHVRGEQSVSFPSPYAFTAPDGEGDPDGDGVTSAEERRQGTHPFRAPDEGPSPPVVVTVVALWAVAAVAAALAALATLAKAVRRLVGRAPSSLADRSVRRLLAVAAGSLVLSALAILAGTVLPGG